MSEPTLDDVQQAQKRALVFEEIKSPSLNATRDAVSAWFRGEVDASRAAPSISESAAA